MKRTKVLILIIVLVTLLSSSCRTSRFSENQVQLVQYSLKEADLPGSDWMVEVESWESAYGGESYGIVYIRDKSVFINHVISIHASEHQAQQAYQEWEKEWLDLANLQPYSSYSPLNIDDDYRYECFQMKPDDPLIICYYLQRHDQIISFVKINLDKRSKDNLTFEEVKDILSILDERLNEVVVEVTP